MMVRCIFVITIVVGAAGVAQAGPASAVRNVRSLRAVAPGLEHPQGALWLSNAECFVLVAADGDHTRLASLDAYGNTRASATIGARIRGENVAFDARRSQLLMLDDVTDEIVSVNVDATGGVDVASVRRLRGPLLGPVRATGIAFDAERGTLFVLDHLTQRIAIVPEAVWNGTAMAGERVGWIELDELGARDLRGLAWDGDAGTWYVLDAARSVVHAIAETGEERSRWDVSAFGLASPRALLVAPSGDHTDAATHMSVYITDAGQGSRSGRVVEMGFSPVEPLAVSATVTGSLVRTIYTSQWSPPSPDPSGMAYDPVQGRLLVSDGEVEEMSIYQNVNFYECSLTGTLLRTSHTRRFSDEPVGTAFVSASRVFISDDDTRRINMINVGADGHVGGSDDTWTVISTTSIGIDDPEGISYDGVNKRIFIGGGIDSEIYVIQAGKDGVFGTSDDVRTHFDVATYGVTDNETCEYNPNTNTLYVMGRAGDKIIEVTPTGALLNVITTSSVPWSNPAGMALAPKSNDPTKLSLYVCCRGTDNDSHPTENDGKIFEISASILGDNNGGGGTIDPPTAVTDFFPAAGSDDAEQAASGSVTLTSSDLELIHDSSDQTVGVRFTNITIAKNAVISQAWIQFTADETQADSTALTIFGQADDNPGTFLGTSGNVSTRLRTLNSVAWTPLPWDANDGPGPNQKTPSLTRIVQELVNRGGWTSGYAMAFVFTGTGHRTAKAFEAGAGPVLHIDVTASTSNRSPSVNAGGDQTITLPASATLQGTAADTDGPSALTTTWAKVSGPAGGAVAFGNLNAPATSATFSVDGIYVLRLTATDGLATVSDEVQITVNPTPPTGGGTVVDKRIAAGTDDVEENAAGKLLFTSSDLELVFDGNLQVVGLRFTGVGIPQNATITSAYIQFTRNETQTEATTLTFQGEATDNPGAFANLLGNVSTRPRTAASVVWTPPGWLSGEKDTPSQRTPDLSPILRELVIRSGWVNGGAIVFIITGTGHRTATSYEGAASSAPLLHVEFAPIP